MGVDFAHLMDAQTLLRKAEFVLSMVPRGKKGRLVHMKDATTMLRKDQFVLNMVPRRKLAVIKDAPTKPRREGFV